MTLQEIQNKAQSIIQKWRDDDSAPYIEFVEELAHMTVPEPSEDLEEAAEKHSTDYDSTIWCVLESSNQKTIWKREHKETFIAGAKWGAEHCGSSETPKDLESYAQKVEDYYDVGEERGYLCVHRGGVKEAVIAGAKWDREQGVSMEGVASRKYDNQYHGFPSILVCDVSAMVNQLIPQDTEAKVIVQIRKKDE